MLFLEHYTHHHLIEVLWKLKIYATEEQKAFIHSTGIIKIFESFTEHKSISRFCDETSHILGITELLPLFLSASLNDYGPEKLTFYGGWYILIYDENRPLSKDDLIRLIKFKLIEMKRLWPYWIS